VDGRAGEVDADLVLASRLGAGLDERVPGEAAQDAEAGHRVESARRHRAHHDAALRVEEPERLIDDSVVGRCALDEGEVGLRDLASREREREGARRLARAREEQDPRRLPIDPWAIWTGSSG